MLCSVAIKICLGLIGVIRWRETIRWYLKFFLHLFDVAIWIENWLLNRIHFSKMYYLGLRNNLQLKLLNIVTDVFISQCIRMQHFPVKLEERLRCRVCARIIWIFCLVTNIWRLAHIFTYLASHICDILKS